MYPYFSLDDIRAAEHDVLNAAAENGILANETAYHSGSYVKGVVDLVAALVGENKKKEGDDF